MGPFSYLRPGTKLGRKAKVGGFVETKNAELADGAKVPHLSYVGDASIGAKANIGAGTIFANYDGVNKHRTTVGDAAFVGSDTVLIAPVEIGPGAYVAAGSAIGTDVPAGNLGVTRAPQRNIEGWTARKRPGTVSAEAAAKAEAADRGVSHPTLGVVEPWRDARLWGDTSSDYTLDPREQTSRWAASSRRTVRV